MKDILSFDRLSMEELWCSLAMMLSTVIGNIASAGKVKLLDLEFLKSFCPLKGPTWRGRYVRST